MSWLPGVLYADWPTVEFSAARLEFEGAELADLRMELSDGQTVTASARQLSVDGMQQEITDLSLAGNLVFEDETTGGLGFIGELEILGFDASVAVDYQPGLTEAVFALREHDLLGLAVLEQMPGELGWVTRGTFDARFALSLLSGAEADISFDFAIKDLAFDSPDGRFAGEALFIESSGSLDPGANISLTVEGAIGSGELLIENFYRDFSDASLFFSLGQRLIAGGNGATSFRLTDNSALLAEGQALWGDDQYQVEVRRLELQFPAAYQRYLESAAAQWTLDGLEVTGSVAWNGQWSDGEFSAGNLEVTDLSLVDIRRNRFAVTGLDAHVRPGDHSFDSRLGWRGLLFGRINLGAGQVALDSEPGVIELLQPLELDVFEGKLNLDRLRILLPGSTGKAAGEPDIQLVASLFELDMQRLTAAMGWPAFNGKISGEIPGVRFQEGVLEVEGEILVEVFDGLISLDDLRIERPFGVLPSLAGNVEISDLDLERLTSTFSFGQIAGRLDGYVNDLRMLDWRPVSFDAWLGTPDRQSARSDISRQAVNRLTTIGGGSATTALTSPLLRVFNKFSYRRLGLGCRLQNNVCEVRGIGEDEISVLLMEGAGVPKITIRAFNRRVDWPQMVSNLLALSGDEPAGTGN